MKHTRSCGFTLVEVLIAVVILGLLSSLALSSYGNYIRKARRADAKADLLELAQLIERNYTESNRFHEDVTGAAYALEYNRSPRQGQKFYDLRFAAGQPTTTTYVIEAVPFGPQTRDTRCLTLTLDQAGNKGIDAGATGTVAECW
ncbi:MAG: type IV pilin protein [Thiohalobacterales bacterium]|nr:type IV pilin protein [Thiohalobacterales bacterium]